MTWWTWFLNSFAGLLDGAAQCRPPALAALERWQLGRGGDFLLVTQNIDTLHEQAGSRRLVKVHGTADRLRCSRAGCALGAPTGSLPASGVDFTPFRSDPRRETPPPLPGLRRLAARPRPALRRVLHAHADYGFDRVRAALERMALAVFAGTSFSVGVTDLVLREASAGASPSSRSTPPRRRRRRRHRRAGRRRGRSPGGLPRARRGAGRLERGAAKRSLPSMALARVRQTQARPFNA